MDYTRLKCTERVSETIEKAGDGCIELREWKESGATTCIPFSLLLNIHTNTVARSKRKLTAAKHFASFTWPAFDGYRWRRWCISSRTVGRF